MSNAIRAAAAAFEQAIEADDVAARVWCAARDLANAEANRLGLQGCFDMEAGERHLGVLWRFEYGSDGVPLSQAGLDVATVAERYALAEAFAAMSSADRKRQIAEEVLLCTPCADDDDTIEKFRVLRRADHFSFAEAYEAVRAIVTAAERESMRAVLKRDPLLAAEAVAH